MSSQNNSIWLPNGSGSVPNGEISYNPSTRIQQKRAHQWFTGSPEQELIFYKKQAVESTTETSGPAVIENSLWQDGSSFPSEGQTPGLFCPKPVHGLNVSGKDITAAVSNSMNMEKGFENLYRNEPAICLTMSRPVEDPLFLNTGHRKVKVNEVTISENCLPEFEKNRAMSTPFLRSGSNIFPGPTYITTELNNILVDPAYSELGKEFVSVGQPSNQRDGNFMLINQYFNGIDNHALSVGQALNPAANYSINSVGRQYEKENGNFTLTCPTYSRGHGNFLALDPFYSDKVNETFMPTGSNKADTNINFGAQQDATVVSLGAVCNKGNSSILSMVENSKKGEGTTISFGGFQNNIEERDHSGRLISSQDVLVNQSSGQFSEAFGQKETADQFSANVVSAASSVADGTHKNKDNKTKKGSSNNFPSNVKSLLSTGILDGVPVKYVSWSREKNLRGVVKGTGYLCSCQECKLSKAINAYEFERHAGCKTKHPNNHIYFENGKTIYAVVQELKSTPQEMLFDVMQNVTGSAVNHKNFSAWKASYQAATRELQRIYGKEDKVVAT